MHVLCPNTGFGGQHACYIGFIRSNLASSFILKEEGGKQVLNRFYVVDNQSDCFLSASNIQQSCRVIIRNNLQILIKLKKIKFHKASYTKC